MKEEIGTMSLQFNRPLCSTGYSMHGRCVRWSPLLTLLSNWEICCFANILIIEKQDLFSTREVVNTRNADLLHRLRQLEELNELLMQRLRYVECLVWDVNSLVQKMACAMLIKIPANTLSTGHNSVCTLKLKVSLWKYLFSILFE